MSSWVAEGKQPVGLIAAGGRFPVIFAEKAREVGLPVVCLGIADMADPALQTICHEFHWCKRMSMGWAMRKFRKAGVTRWTSAGKFHKHILLQPWKWLRFMPDFHTLRWWFIRRRRQDNKDDSIMLSLINEFRLRGFECVSALDLCPELLVRSGVLTQRTPTEKELADIRFGWTLAKEMGRLDVGQSVMVKDKACIAVEAIEGTDRCILRAGEFTKYGFVVVKVAKPQQDMRFDVPTVGTQTIENMTKSGATALGIEAGKTIMLDEAVTIAAANKAGIAIVSLEDGK